jgi:DNA-binding NtrC family response regulator
MITLWIVHRDSRIRSALARVAAAPESAISGPPGDPLFLTAPAADVVVLGLAGDLEAELEFAHQTASRLRDARWILVPERGDSAAVKALFDSIDATILSYPPDARTLRAEIHATDLRSTGGRLALSERPSRDLLAERFARWFADLELPEVMRALDPRLWDVPLLIAGETGTGRGLMAQYVHVFGPGAAGELAHVVCQAGMSAADLDRALSEAAREATAARTVWLEDVDSLPLASQRRLARWLELGPPAGMRRTRIGRWIGTISDAPELGPQGSLDPGLRDRLSGISLRIPPLRQRTQLIAPLANQTALAWCSAHRELPRRFGEDAITVLEEYPWPGNLQEFEAVVLQTLVAGSADPIRADDLQYDGTAFAPLDANAFGVLIDSDEAAASNPAAVPATAVERSADAARPAETGRPKAAPTTAPLRDSPLQPLAAAIAHEVRNPLSTIRTFAELLPERYDDPEFRSRFSELVGQDALRIESVVARLVELAALGREPPSPVDISALLDELLDTHRELIHSRGLLVLRELDAQPPHALGDAGQLGFALESLVARSLRLAPEGGEVYIASRHHRTGLRGGPAIRVLVRFGERGQPASRPRVVGTSAAENAVEFAIAQAIIRAQGGTFAIDAAEGGETVVLLDIPA